MAKKDVDILVRVRDRASAGLKRLGSVAKGLAKTFGLVAAAGSAITTIIGAKFLTGAIRSAGQFDEAMSTVGAVTGATAEQLERLRDTADEAAARTRFTATEAANGLEELSRAGFDANASMTALNPVLDLAAGNNQTVAESAIQVTTALNAFGLAADEAGRVADVYTRAAQRSAQTTAQLGEAMTFVAPVARQAGIDIEQTAALVGRLADAGFRGSLGGTALRNAILQFQDPASTFRAELERLGIRTDNFVDALEGLAGAGDGAEAAIRALGLRAGPAIQAIVAGGVPALQKLTAELKNAEGATRDAATAMEDNLPGALRAFGSAFDQFRRRLVAPLVVRIKEEVQDLTQSLLNFTASGALQNFSTLLVDAFNAGVRAVREFVGQIDFDSIGRKIQEFAINASARLSQFGSDALELRKSFRTITGGIEVFAGSLVLAFNAVATGFAGLLTFLNRQVQRHLEAAQRFTLGLNPIVNRALKEVTDVQNKLEAATDKFAENTAVSLVRVAEGWQRLSTEAQQAAAAQVEAQTRAAEAAEETARRTAATAEELATFREEARRNLEIVRGWDEQVQRAGESSQRTGEQVAGLGQAASQTGDQIEEAGEKAETAGDQQEDAAFRALTAWLDFGDGLEAVTFQVQELAGTASTLEQLRAQAEAATPPIERLREAIEAASRTDQLDLVVQAMARLREEGGLTADQYEDLTRAVVEQAAAMEESAEATSRQTDELADLAGQSRVTAQGLDQVGRAARGASQQAIQTAQGFGAILDSWRELGPEANAAVDEFIRQMNAFPQLSFSVARSRIARFTQDMEARFGSLREATQEARNEAERFSEFDRDGDGTATVQRTIDVNFTVQRDPEGPLVLSEANIQRIAERVLSAIQADSGRTGG